MLERLPTKIRRSHCVLCVGPKVCKQPLLVLGGRDFLACEFGVMSTCRHDQLQSIFFNHRKAFIISDRDFIVTDCDGMVPGAELARQKIPSPTTNTVQVFLPC